MLNKVYRTWLVAGVWFVTVAVIVAWSVAVDARLSTSAFRLIAVPPAHALPIASPIMPASEEGRRLGLDRYLQQVARETTDKPRHRRLLRRRGLGGAQQPFDFFLHANARWYSLHGVDLLRPRYQRGSLV
jgi:hypothetical protein